MAYLLAQCAPPLKLPDTQPTAYSYNGVVLPDIHTVYTPELQKTHRYAAICNSGLTAYLYLLSTPISYVRTAAITYKFYAPETDGTAVVYSVGTLGNTVYPETAVWELYEEIDLTANTEFRAKASFKWANFDMLNADGEIHLDATEPILVNK